MADLGDGYARIANELLEELAKRKLNSTQASIVFFIFRQTYGFQRKSHDMSLNYIAGIIGANKDQVKRELNRLIEWKVVRVFEEAGFTKSRVIGINSECAEWEAPSYTGLVSIQGANQHPLEDAGKVPEGPSICDVAEDSTQGANEYPGRGLISTPAQGANQPPIKRYSFKDNYKDIIYTIFKHWNSKKIVVHRELTTVTESAINARLKVSSEKDIIEAIDNYHFCLKSEDHFYSYKFNLKDFMNPKNLEKFFTENDPFNNFLNRGSTKNKAAPVSDDVFLKRLEELDSEEN
ncbi:replication protein [Paenibacillus sp. FSL K6-2524]|uniref:replication protein n=1 Tax=Paenibacillus sp. FSL K6-2524 TaxID=2954516 RepID=UPI0030F62E13